MEQKIAKTENELPKELILSVEEKFKEYESIALEWNKKAYEIEVTDESQVELMEQAKQGRLLLKAKRVEIEKTRKKLKDQSLQEGRFIDSIAKRLSSIIEPAENYLLTQEKYAETKEQLRKLKIKNERLDALKPYIDFVDLNDFDLSTMSDVAFNTIFNGAKISFENHEKQKEQLRQEQEERNKKYMTLAERKRKIAPYSFFIKNEEDVVLLDTTEEEFQVIYERLCSRKKEDDQQKELLKKQNEELQKKVANSEKKLEKTTQNLAEFKAIAKSNLQYVKSLEDIKKEHTDMRIVLEKSLNFIIPDNLRKLIESTLKSLK